jgi:hypothetical protein
MKISAFFIRLPTILAIAACDGVTPSQGFVGTPPLKIGGGWTYKLDVIDASGIATCQTYDGTLTINPTAAGDTSNGNVRAPLSCTVGVDSEGYYGISAVTAGELTGESVRFVAYGACVHQGALSGSPPDHASGTVINCSFAPLPDYPARTFNGTWEASR